jgi:hypothetical protein
MLNSASEEQFDLVNKHQARIKRRIQHSARWMKLERNFPCSIIPWPEYRSYKLNSRCVHKEHY